ncbi:MAG: hypothetical protein VYD87_07835 [Pseudomonadota bacterium]|nr:hypothetical protein [Pseudomonadota bacterium]
MTRTDARAPGSGAPDADRAEALRRGMADPARLAALLGLRDGPELEALMIAARLGRDPEARALAARLAAAEALPFSAEVLLAAVRPRRASGAPDPDHGPAGPPEASGSRKNIARTRRGPSARTSSRKPA